MLYIDPVNPALISKLKEMRLETFSPDHIPETNGAFECYEDLFNYVRIGHLAGVPQRIIAKSATVSVGTVNRIIKDIRADRKVVDLNKRLKELWKPTNPFGHGVSNYEEL
tara:strand:- start:1018 stop:1347 length:330 start_codon:yes stop_codon:yes gene_type:complete